MFALKPAGLVRRFKAFRHALALRGVHPPRQFAWILQRERSRADRTGIPFSVVTFQPRGGDGGRAALAQLVRILRRRLRCTDELGWLSSRELAVALAHTDPDGAWTVVQDVCSQLPPGSPWPVCRVYNYPFEQQWRPLGRPGASRAPRMRLRVDDMEPLFVQALPAWKRAMDLLGAGLGLALLAPVFGLTAVLIKLSSPGPVLFRQYRSGRGGDPFVRKKK